MPCKVASCSFALEDLVPRKRCLIVTDRFLMESGCMDDLMRLQKLFNYLTQCVGLGEAGNLVAELEVGQYVLHIGRTAVKVDLKIIP
jgi:hypothetical protein